MATTALALLCHNLLLLLLLKDTFPSCDGDVMVMATTALALLCHNLLLLLLLRETFPSCDTHAEGRLK
eukprot:11759410-Alexandrium_andersonii.AAC.1